ncbi:hypothetical protein LOTGIDRAFT_173251 [Lottia gigantea]|uniref:Acetylserotonin O-methyltransferase n=1 Tax=Lottia gigantea TaxID=225164 RepID=V4B257_LOTGI|nr:hypothetical protein LOTGIDRAFT_173251 [Lottia gigantea]ESP00347.1 hypothetical protein LOTGIDRAFT_173251 [Lottia gigantea]
MASDDTVLRSDPLADPIMEIGFGVFKASLVCQAIELGIFDKIEVLNKKVTAVGFANNYGYKPEVTERILDALVCYGLLNKSNSQDEPEYSNSKTVQKYLLKSDQPCLNSTLLGIRLLSQFVDKLDTVIKQGSNNTVYERLLDGSEDGRDFTNSKLERQEIKTDQNQNPVAERKKTNKTDSSAHSFMVQMDSLLRPAVHAITVAFDVAGHKTLLDLGGNSGYLAFEFIKTYPQLKAIVLDRPHTIQLAKKYQPAHTKSKVEFIEGDFFDNKKFPEVDLMMLSHIIHNWDEDKLDILLTKTYQSLKPGGTLLVAEKLLNEDKIGPEITILLDVTMTTVCNGRERTLSEYQKLLGRYGFQNIEGKRIAGVNYFDVIIARKPDI